MNYQQLASISGIYLVTDSTISPGRSHVDIVVAAIEGGVQVVQLRDKHLPERELLAAAREIRQLTAVAGVTFIVNDSIEVALASGADGAHIGASDISPREARAMLGPDHLLGISAATLTEAKAAAPYASYFGVGTVFSTTTKSDAGEPVGLERLRMLRSAYPIFPIVAIGGINRENLSLVRDTGVDAAAVVSAIVCADDMVAATRDLIEIWQARTPIGVR